jgi:uncharacterized membrane protein (DUF485 family)
MAGRIRADAEGNKQLFLFRSHLRSAQETEAFHRRKLMSIWTVLFVILLIAWLGGFMVFHVAGGLIHLLLLFAVISLILHFVMGSRTT